MALATGQALNVPASSIEAAREWIAGDPDPETRMELQRLVDSADEAGLERAMGKPLDFGTAGIRGEVGPGPARMNRAVVIRTTGGLARYLTAQGRAALPVVLGFDARPASKAFAEDAAGVLASAGITVQYFPEVTPTPLVAFAAKHLGAGAAIVVTASHNPPADNGYKVYGANAAQIIPPEDADIASAILESPPANVVPRLERAFEGDHRLISPVDATIIEEYLDEVNQARPSPRPSTHPVVYTAMHGVGGRFLAQMFDRAGHTGLIAVPAQFSPDGTFPTLSFPNPEEEGALDLALELATELGADVVFANDPDADRFSAAIHHEGKWRVLSGNELGALLGDYVLRKWAAPQTPIVVNSIVSSPILGEIAARRGACHEVTLTGFKWIVNAGLSLENAGAGQFAFGFEEALGYTVGHTVRDKDGLSAALVFSDLIAEESATGRSVMDRLHDIWTSTGLWASAQRSMVRAGREGPSVLAAAVGRLGESPPADLGGHPVSEIVDYRFGAEKRPPWLGGQDLIELKLAGAGRVLVRPSGTEPKLKIYVDLNGALGENPDVSHRELTAEAISVANEMGEWLGL